MSGTIAIALASLLLQQAAPHPSTLRDYQPPAVRPYEPASDFGRERPAEGDNTGERYRAPIARPVAVEAYERTYEFSPRASEDLYDLAVSAAEGRADQSAGPMDGAWRVFDARGRPLLDLTLNDRDGLIEGGWRGAGPGSGHGGAAMTGQTLTLEDGGALALDTAGSGAVLTRDGRSVPVTLNRLP
jgi:hypothetical protein